MSAELAPRTFQESAAYMHVPIECIHIDASSSDMHILMALPYSVVAESMSQHGQLTTPDCKYPSAYDLTHRLPISQIVLSRSTASHQALTRLACNTRTLLRLSLAVHVTANVVLRLRDCQYCSSVTTLA